jgi:DNA modification methylase
MSVQAFLDGRVVLHGGDCRAVLAALADNSIDSIVTDPPYALVSIVKRFGKPGSAPATGNDAYARASAGFMGKQWDTGEAAFAVEFWAQCLRVLKPGGHVAAFSGTRTYHRLACAIEDAGFEIRDQLAWTYGTGFPKSYDVSKGIDKAAGLTGQVIATGVPVKRMIPGADQHKSGWEKTNGREFQPGDYVPATAEAADWQGWGTALKPAWEPIVLARKPLEGTVAANVLKWGTGAINVDSCRVGAEHLPAQKAGQARLGTFERVDMVTAARDGRFPANVIHDGSDEVVSAFPSEAGAGGPASGPSLRGRNMSVPRGAFNGLAPGASPSYHADSGSAARFFYSAKAGATDRIGSKHPTVKPVDLMQWLCRLITPPGGTVLDPFSGTGTTGEAAWREGFSAVLVEREAEYQADIAERMRLCLAGPGEKARAIAKRKAPALDAGPLFGGVDTPPVTGDGFTDSLPTKTAGAAVESS